MQMYPGVTPQSLIHEIAFRPNKSAKNLLNTTESVKGYHSLDKNV